MLNIGFHRWAFFKRDFIYIQMTNFFSLAIIALKPKDINQEDPIYEAVNFSNSMTFAQDNTCTKCFSIPPLTGTSEMSTIIAKRKSFFKYKTLQPAPLLFCSISPNVQTSPSTDHLANPAESVQNYHHQQRKS